MAPHLQPTGDSDPVSHNDELFYQELPELNTPYTTEELISHQSCRALKCALEEHHAHNYRLINEAQAWINFLYHGGPKPRCNIGAFFMMESAEAKVNNVPTPMKVFCQSLRDYGFGLVPRFRVCIYCSRSSATLYKLLEDIYNAPELVTLKSVEAEIYELLTNQCINESVKFDWDKHITFLYQQYLANSNVYSAKLSTFVQEKELEYKLRTTGHFLTLPATVGDVRKATKSESIKVISAVKKATSEDIKGCHHRNKTKDKLVQEVIRFLAKPGITFSIHNACRKIAPDEGTWLYDWCHAHENDIQTAAGILKAQTSV